MMKTTRIAAWIAGTTVFVIGFATASGFGPKTASSNTSVVTLRGSAGTDPAFSGAGYEDTASRSRGRVIQALRASARPDPRAFASRLAHAC
jgi:hypothetical protein